MALPLALAIILVLTITVGATIEFSSSSSRGASLNLKRQDVKALAEGGIANGASVLGQELADDESFAGDLSGTATIEGVSVPWTAAYQATSPKSWFVTATASRSNPTGPASSPVVRTVASQFEWATDNGIWNFVYVKPTPGGCLTFSNNFTMTSPLYVDGNLCLINSALYDGPRLYVNGTVTVDSPTAGVGTPATPIPTVSVKDNGAGSGCRYTTSGSFALPCTAAHRVWSTSFNTTVPPQTKPTIELDTRYADAAPGSTARNHRCYAASMNDLKELNSKIGENWSSSRAGLGWAGASDRLDDNTTRDTSLGVVDLMPSASYDCRMYSSTGALLGSVAWTDGSPGTLTVSGVVFFDADIKIAGADGIVNGFGQIYANNKIVLENNTSVCGVADCGSSWNPNSTPPHLLFLYAGYSGATSLEVQNSARFQGGLYANGGMVIGNHAMVHGPAIADELVAHNNSDFFPWPWFTDLPDTIPGTTKVLRLKPGSWQG